MKLHRLLNQIILINCMLICSHFFVSGQQKLTFSDLHNGDLLDGFTARSVYLNDAKQPIGGRFIHKRSGFTLDLLQIESVPQTYIWVNTFPTSDKGEPHTQEHLLITKGNKGHQLNTTEGMSLANSNAFTQQMNTAYHFFTGAGPETFYSLFEEYMDALLHPDYTDEEIRREVMNWGITENPDKTLRLEEKGAVYNEMTTSMTNPFSVLFYEAQRMLYGNEHPLSYNAGGMPAAIREIKPEDIRKFHASHYHLANMGSIASLPKNMDLSGVLKRMNSILLRLEPNQVNQNYPSKNNLPAALPAEQGKIQVVEYPSKNTEDAGNMIFVYPSNRNLDLTENLLLDNFLSVFAGDATTNLYKKFVDSKTRALDLGAQGIFNYSFEYPGKPLILAITSISSTNLTIEKTVAARKIIMDELEFIASLPDNSPQLMEFNKRLQNSLIDSKRGLSKLVNTPPKFGFRNTGSDWYDQLDKLDREEGFSKSIILGPEYDAINKILAQRKNIWKDYLQRWHLTGTTPYGLVSKANPKLIDQDDKERKSRAEHELTRLREKYSVSDDQQAIQKYRTEYTTNTTQLENIERSQPVRFISNPPLTLDDELVFHKKIMPGHIPIVASTFNNMSSATTGLSLKLDAIPQDKLVYLAILPQLLTFTGVIKDGKAISYEEMSQLLQQQILSLNAEYNTNFSNGRAELEIRGSGNNLEEAQRAIGWMNLILQSPYWKKENLSRLRDVTEQELSGLRKRMQDREEAWVKDPGNAYWRQDNPLLLSTSSFLTRAHNVLRLKWMLRDAGNDANKKAIDIFLREVGDLKASREEVKAFVSALQGNKTSPAGMPVLIKAQLESFGRLPEVARANAIEIAKDLEQALNDIPEESLKMDWKYLCNQLLEDLMQGPEKTLQDLNSLRQSLLNSSEARLFLVSSSVNEEKLSSSISALIGGLKNNPVKKVHYSPVKHIDQRVKERTQLNDEVVFVGLVNPNSKTGVFINTATLTSYHETSDEKILQFLSAQLYSGGGKQSVYTKTTGAGLSYSTGVGVNPASGRLLYYAERTPELPQTLKFVIDEIKRSPKDTSMRDYVIALSFGTRGANDYESRGKAIADDLEDDITPDIVRNFRKAILAQRYKPALIEEIYNRKDNVYSSILPGYGAKGKDVSGAVYFVIGNEKQMLAYESYLRSVEGNETKLVRLYPRDFWIVK